MDEMDKKAVGIVTYYLKKRIGRLPDFRVFIVWKAKILQNWKYMLASTLADNEYYELTYDGFRQFWYLDVYEKRENIKYMDDTVRAEIMRKVEDELSK